MKKINKITIVGVGLIGGSMGLALKKHRIANEIVGVGHRVQSIKKAIKLKTIDRGTLNLRSGVKDADIIILATPILDIPKLIKNMKSVIKKGCIITDVGSVKGYIAQEMERILPKGINFVGAHPMAGSEKRGVDKARGDLFKKSVCILTKTRKTNKPSLNVLKRLWREFGAKVVELSPDTHDKIVSEISHLPHMVVFTILSSIDQKSLKLASSGFFDTTRIASSDAKIWKDIAISNRCEILKSINKFKKELTTLEKSICRKDSKKLLSIFSNAKKKRENL